MFTARASNFLESGVLVPPVGNHLHDLGLAGTFETRDGYINITAWPDAAFRRLCAALDLGDLWTDHRFATPQLRATHRAALTDILNATLRLRTTPEWIDLLHQQHIPCGPISTCTRCLQTHRSCITAWCLSITIPQQGSGDYSGFRCGSVRHQWTFTCQPRRWVSIQKYCSRG
jgi:crotonobetainyl-CoA:carnitine CoA-transferase CaiB-like acyl-CoA transferase